MGFHPPRSERTTNDERMSRREIKRKRCVKTTDDGNILAPELNPSIGPTEGEHGK